MNLTLLLLTLFCFASQAIVVSRKKSDPSKAVFTEAIQDKTRNLIERIKRDFEMIAEKVHEIGNEAIQKLQRVIGEEETKLATFAAQTKDKEQQLKEKKGILKSCSDTYKTELETVKASAQDQLTACVDGAIGAIKNFTNGVSSNDVRYKKFVEDELFRECGMSNRNDALRCALEKIDEAAFAIKTIEKETIDDAYKCTVETNIKIARMVGKNGLTFRKCCEDGLQN